MKPDSPHPQAAAAAAALAPGDAEGGAWSAFEADLERVAASGVAAPAVPATVLLTGESGSGKSRAARRLHDASPRAAGPFVAVQLAALASSLIEAELFGHEAGAFTGASGARLGRFELASGGTLVLEGVETLALDLQVKLLRVLQERIVEPLGAESGRSVDVRVIATTARDLRGAVEAGAFREDLYYRLAVVPLSVPPLRVRAGGPDFRDLCASLVADVAVRLGVASRTLSPEALGALAAHPWPGNFRELENALERALVLGGTAGALEAEHFEFLGETIRGRASELAQHALASGVGLEELDAAVLAAALEESRGNVAAAARRVGLSRRAFDYRQKRSAEADRSS
jgi:transcriptional regulator with PAS, ATPase and Fis domain